MGNVHISADMGSQVKWIDMLHLVLIALVRSIILTTAGNQGQPYVSMTHDML